MGVAETLRSLTRNERVLILVALAAITVISWTYLFFLERDMGEMSDMTVLAPTLAAWSAADTLAMFVMWVVMMCAMMLPSAAPMILLYAALRARSREAAVAHTGLFATGYIVVWCGFSAMATFLQWSLEQAALLSTMMTLNSTNMGAAILIGAGIYQMTPFKNRCLSKCRAPAQFLAANWRTAPGGALYMGLVHGLYCLGCCWAVMLLLFVGGVMNLLWIAALAAFVLVEKLVPAGPIVARASGILIVASGLWLLASS